MAGRSDVCLNAYGILHRPLRPSARIAALWGLSENPGLCVPPQARVFLAMQIGAGVGMTAETRHKLGPSYTEHLAMGRLSSLVFDRG